MNRKDQTAATPAEVKPNTGQGAQRSPAAVGAGPGNQVQDNFTQPVSGEIPETDLKPGAQPDGTMSVTTGTPRNEGVEQTDETRDSSGIE
jgi:hypothetical protein